MSAPAETAAQMPPGRGGSAHQLVITATVDHRDVAVSCTCLRAAGLEPIGVRPRWGGGEAYTAWLGHLAAGSGVTR